MITVEELKNILAYDELTGLFTWKIYKSKYAKVGSIAGSYAKQLYVIICINQKKYRAHHLAWLYVYGEYPNQFIDHINGIRDDNKITNLRLATSQQNIFNSKTKVSNTSGFKGVSYRKNRNHWIAQATLNYKPIYIGSYHSKEDASKAYNKFCKENHGEFYRNSLHGVA